MSDPYASHASYHSASLHPSWSCIVAPAHCCTSFPCAPPSCPSKLKPKERSCSGALLGMQILRKRRADRGALQLASPEVKFTIDTETHDPLDVGMYQVRWRHATLSCCLVAPQQLLGDGSRARCCYCGRGRGRRHRVGMWSPLLWGVRSEAHHC